MWANLIFLTPSYPVVCQILSPLPQLLNLPSLLFPFPLAQATTGLFSGLRQLVYNCFLSPISLLFPSAAKGIFYYAYSVTSYLWSGPYWTYLSVFLWDETSGSLWSTEQRSVHSVFGVLPAPCTCHCHRFCYSLLFLSAAPDPTARSLR